MQEETGKIPTHYLGNQQVLRLAHHGGHATQGCTDCTVHQQAAQEGPEVFQIFPVQFDHFVVTAGVVILVLIALTGSHLVVNRVETHCDADDHGSNGQGIQERRKYGGCTAEQQG